MPSLDTFDPLATPRDYVKIGGKRTPGTAQIAGLSSKHEYAEWRTWGSGGAVVVYRGRKPSHFSIVVRLSTGADWAAWHAFRVVLDRETDRNRNRGLDIEHPWCTMHGIRSVVVEEVSQPVEADNGDYLITVKVIESRPVKRSLAKVEGSKGPEPADPAEIRMQQLTQQVQQLAEIDSRL